MDLKPCQKIQPPTAVSKLPLRRHTRILEFGRIQFAKQSSGLLLLLGTKLCTSYVFKFNLHI